MDGDIALLKEIVALTEQHNASLIVDEAHATGIFGKQGAGIVCELNVESTGICACTYFRQSIGLSWSSSSG